MPFKRKVASFNLSHCVTVLKYLESSVNNDQSTTNHANSLY